MASAIREAVIDFDFLRGGQNEAVLKDLCVLNARSSRCWGFRALTKWSIRSHLRSALIVAVGNMEYKDLHTVVTEIVAGFAHLYTYGVL